MSTGYAFSSADRGFRAAAPPGGEEHAEKDQRAPRERPSGKPLAEKGRAEQDGDQRIDQRDRADDRNRNALDQPEEASESDRRAEDREVGERTDRRRSPSRRLAALDERREGQEKRRSHQCLPPDVHDRIDASEMLLDDDAREGGHDRRHEHESSAAQKRSEVRLQRPPEGSSFDERHTGKSQPRSGYRARRQRLVREEEVREDAGAARKRREEQGGQAGLDPLLRDEDEPVEDADLEEPGERDKRRFPRAGPAIAVPERERREHEARERHAQGGEAQRRKVLEPDLDREPGRAPDRAEKNVHDERAAPKRRRNPAA